MTTGGRKVLVWIVVLSGIVPVGIWELFRPAPRNERIPSRPVADESWRLQPLAHLSEVCRILIGDPQRSAEAAAAFLRGVALARGTRDCPLALIRALSQDDHRPRPRLSGSSAVWVRNVLFVCTDLTPQAVAAGEKYRKEAVSQVHRALIASLGNWPTPLSEAQVRGLGKLLAEGKLTSKVGTAATEPKTDLSDPEARRLAIQLLVHSGGDATRLAQFESILKKLLEHETLEDVIDSMACVIGANMRDSRGSAEIAVAQTAGTQIGLVLRRHPNDSTAKLLAYRLQRSDSALVRRMMIVALGVSRSTSPAAQSALEHEAEVDEDRAVRETALANFGTIGRPDDVVRMCKERVERPLRTFDDILDASSALGALGNLASHDSQAVGSGAEVVRDVLRLPVNSLDMPLIVEACSSRFSQFHRVLRTELESLAKSSNTSVSAAANGALGRIEGPPGKAK